MVHIQLIPSNVIFSIGVKSTSLENQSTLVLSENEKLYEKWNKANKKKGMSNIIMNIHKQMWTKLKLQNLELPMGKQDMPGAKFFYYINMEWITHL